MPPPPCPGQKDYFSSTSSWGQAAALLWRLMWCALQHEPCVGATEMLFNLYNKKYIAFFCSITRRGVSVFLAMWRGIATRMEAGFVFSELARLQFPFTFSLTCKCSIRSKAVCNSLYSSYLNLHLSLWVHINALSAQHYILLSWRQIMSLVICSIFLVFYFYW